MNPTSLALAIGGSVALVTAIVGMIIIATRRNHDCGCAGASLCHGDCGHCHVHTSHTHHDHGLPRRTVIRINVDELRDHLLRILDLPAVLDRIHGRLNRHRRAITDLRDDHETLGRAHDELNDRVNDHLSQPHDTAAIAEMIAGNRQYVDDAMADQDRRRREEMDGLRTQIRALQDRPVPDHHHRFHTPNWILSGLIGLVAFVVMYLLDLTFISREFVNHFAIIVKHETFGMINFDWSWAKLGLAFAVGFSLFVIVAVATSLFHTERTSPAIGHNVQQAP